jgi:rifampicin phosphotransferase
MTPSAIDTDPHPVFTTYSAGNFAEVAPARLSIVSWSLVGPPQERAMRALGARLWPRAAWATGSTFTFVGYFGCRPYHNLSALCHMAEQVPELTAEAFSASYFENVLPPRAVPGLAERRVDRYRALPRLVREATTLRPRIVEAEGRVVVAEGAVRAALASGSPVALGGALAEARAALLGAWEVHMAATAILPALRALQRSLARRATRFWDELEPWVNRPEELVWGWLRDAARIDGELGPGEFLGEPFYEVAADRPPWSEIAAAEAPPAAGAVSQRGDALDPAQAFWEMPGGGGSRPRAQRARGVAETMASRELSKSLAMRAVHALRRLLPAVAAAHGIADDDWPYLTLAEIVDAHRERGLAARAEARRAACAEALAEPMPDLLDFGPAARPQLDGRPPAPAGRGVSTGVVTGVVVGPDADVAPGPEPRILVRDALDATVGTLLERVDGVVTRRGSMLSHVAILVRERGIPAVVGHPLARELTAGERIRIDGATGEVTRVDG